MTELRWSAACEGFRVYTTSSLLGVVEEVRASAEGGSPTIVVRAGLSGTWAFLFPLADVEHVSFGERSLRLRQGATIVSTERRCFTPEAA